MLLLQKSKYHCFSCNFDACPSHCEPDHPCQPLSCCPMGHPMRYYVGLPRWRCDKDQRLYEGKHLRCQQCDYDICFKCLKEENEEFGEEFWEELGEELGEALEEELVNELEEELEEEFEEESEEGLEEILEEVLEEFVGFGFF
jgi:hypothetical protein